MAAAAERVSVASTPHIPLAIDGFPGMSNVSPQRPHAGSLAVVFLTVFIDLLGFGMVMPALADLRPAVLDR